MRDPIQALVDEIVRTNNNPMPAVFHLKVAYQVHKRQLIDDLRALVGDEYQEYINVFGGLHG